MIAATRIPLVTLVALVAPLAGCRPEFDERESSIDRPRVLGVKIEPPEVKPGETITTTLLVAGPRGPIESPATSFAFCATPKLLTESGSVSAACQGAGVTPIGDGLGTITANVPERACFTFGPETQSAELRPHDPDPTGGFYQPVRARLLPGDGTEALTAFGFVRVTCNLANVPADVAAQLRAYRPNANPTLLPLEARIEGSPTRIEEVPQGARVVLRASWRPEDAETYVALDPASQTVRPRRETMRVSWFTTAGSLESDRTGRTATESETFTENVWKTPAESQRVHLFAVLRDDRGGTAFARLVVEAR